MNRIEYNGAEYTDNDIVSAELFSELSPISETLGYGTFNAVVKSETTALLSYAENTPLSYYYNGNLFATYYVNRITRSGKNRYDISAYDIIGVLSKQQHMGGIYNGQTSREIITDVCGGIDIVFEEEVKSTRMYGWLPIGTRRDNLRRVLFALGAVAKSTRSGQLHIAALSGRVVAELNQIGVGAEVEYPEPVGSVSVTEHQYIQAANAETAVLFEGVTENGDVITFNEPVYDVTAVGISIKATHANYVIVGAGNGTVSGKKYVHTTRELTQTISSGSEEAIYDEGTLVSVVNSAAVLARLVNYHRQSDTITADTRHKRQAPGDTVNILHPYDLKLASAFLLDRQITVSRELISYQRFLLGYVPPDPNEGVYNRVDVITSSGTFTVPAGVTSLRVVLIGGGTGGTSGLSGEAAEESIIETSSSTTGNYTNTTTLSLPGAGGAGGKGGKGGRGGKVYQLTLPVKTGQSFAVSVGTSGKGGAYNASAETAGTEGGSSIFGAYSSNDGAASENGFFEEISGVQYAYSGSAGVDGGKGAGVENREPVAGANVSYKGVVYTPGTTLYDEQLQDSHIVSQQLYTRAIATGGFGGGSAAGSNGGDGTAAGFATATASRAAASPGNGGAGANATKPTTPTRYGVGGDGGNGGGGGGAAGAASTYKNGYYAPNAQLDAYNGLPGAGGNGSAGGDGAPGVVLVYYYVPWTVDYNIYRLADPAELVTSDGLTFIVKKE